MRDGWAQAFAETARAYWTPQQTRRVLGDRTLQLAPRDAPVLLRALGLLHRDGSMPPAQVRKYRQINHMVAVLGPSIRELQARFETLYVLDAACGASYLSMLLAWTLARRDQHGVRVLGVDRNDALIAACIERAAQVELSDVLRYRAAWLGELDIAAAWTETFADAPGRTDAVISLHACDTATDDAIALGLRVGAELIAVAPCCQAELAACWAELDGAGAMAPVHGTPHLRRELAASVTDTMRMLLLRGAGYDATALEFVAPEHTPRNTLIRAMRRRGPDADALREYLALREATGGAGIELERRLPAEVDAVLHQLEGASPG